MTIRPLTNLIRLTAALLCLLGAAVAQAGDTADTAVLIDSLMQELREMKMRELAMQQRLDESDRSAREDSLRQAVQQQRIDSMRLTTVGTPVVVQGDTLLRFYASLGGETPAVRAQGVSSRVLKLGKSLSIEIDSLYVFDGELTTDVMGGETVLLRVSDMDAMWNGTSRHDLARQYAEVIRLEVEKLQAEYGLKAKLRGLVLAVLLIVLQIVMFKLTSMLTRYLRNRLQQAFRDGRLKSLVVGSYQLVSAQQTMRIALIATRLLQALLVLTQLMVSLPLLFSIFPETERITWQIINYVYQPLRDIVVSSIRFLPSLIKIAVIVWVVRWLLRLIRHFANDIENGRLRVDRFYPDWAQPTYQIVRIFIVAFSLVVIWPLLPGSDSGIFKGVSIFVAALFSLGSTASIGNLISGIIITYMRPFKIGDFVKIGDKEGIVIEKNTFVTRLRDIKNNIVTVPNNNILQMETVNYTAPTAEGEGTIVHSDFTFTYHVPRATVEAYLLEAAGRCTLLMKEPPPFVLYTALDDFYTHYEINAYTTETHRLPDVYSELHRHIVDVFAEHGLDPTSNHFVAVTQQGKEN
ncbi:MAG: mechanosensitive ion channel [Prevotella sp.]|nr:mechanosensitive ion channel [Prevotella sp.]